MERLLIDGGTVLSGELRASGAKNSALKMTVLKTMHHKKMPTTSPMKTGDKSMTVAKT